jgi:hypothetical protein
MSNYFIRFIPEDINISLSERDIKFIEELDWNGNTPKFIFSEQILFADAGQNFESVRCPLCKTVLMEWWDNAMCSAYSDEHGFIDIEVATSCCNTIISLNN